MKRYDFGVILGLFVGLAALGWAARLEGVSALFLWQPAALLVVCGGVAGAVLVRRGARGTLAAFRSAFGLLRRERDDEHELKLARLGWLARVAQRDGYHALESHAQAAGDPLVTRGLLLAAELAEPAAVRAALDRALDFEHEAGETDAATLEACGGYAPTFGILGAVLGLISVLRAVDDPSALGTGVATAFVATLYGVGLANLFFFPVAARLRARNERRMRAREELADAILALAARESPSALAQRLSPHSRALPRGRA
jgi:chemotaxis protein MotA